MSSSFVAFAKSFSCISQYFPWSPAQCAASAAFGARACMGSGKSRYTSLILPGYFASSSFTVGSARTQYGHSKSENSTIVIGAVAGPFDGPLASTATFGASYGGSSTSMFISFLSCS